MSRCYRAVIEIWSDTTSTVPFDLESSDVAEIIDRVAEMAETQALQVDYGDMISVWIEDGNKFLDCLAAMPKKHKEIIAIYGDTKDKKSDRLTVFVINDMKENVAVWRQSIDRKGGGCLRIYVDN